MLHALIIIVPDYVALDSFEPIDEKVLSMNLLLGVKPIFVFLITADDTTINIINSGSSLILIQGKSLRVMDYIVLTFFKHVRHEFTIF